MSAKHAPLSAKYNARKDVYAAHRSHEWEERKKKTKEGAWEERKKEWLEKKNVMKIRRNTSTTAWASQTSIGAMKKQSEMKQCKTIGRKNKNGKRMKDNQEKRKPRTQMRGFG